jgi:hypothetical protein
LRGGREMRGEERREGERKTRESMRDQDIPEGSEGGGGGGGEED